MKQIIRTLNMLILFFGLVFLAGCKKFAIDTNASETVIKGPEKEFIDRIKGNIQEHKMYKAGNLLKSTTTISIDSALSYIDETFNYTYSFWYTNYSKFYLDTSYIEIPINEEERVIKYCDLFSSYDNVVSTIHDVFYSYQATDKRIIGLQVQSAGINSQNGTVNVRLISQILIGQGMPLQLGEEDFYYERNTFLCSGIEPPQGPCGAANILEMDVNFILCPAPPPGYRIFFTNQITLYPIAQDYPSGNTIDNFEDYYIFYGNSSNPGWIGGLGGTSCIEGRGIQDSEMDFYTNGMIDQVIPGLLPTVDGRSFQTCYMESTSQSTPSIIIQHTPYIHFGYKHIWRIEHVPDPYPAQL